MVTSHKFSALNAGQEKRMVKFVRLSFKSPMYCLIVCYVLFFVVVFFVFFLLLFFVVFFFWSFEYSYL